MILSDLTGYLARHGRVALLDMAHRFEVDPDALRGMLGALERKGRVHRVQGGASCAGTCCKCDPASLETYEWLGPGRGMGRPQEIPSRK